MNRSFLTADISELAKKLKVDEKIALLGAPNWWNTTAIERLEIPSIRMSDGPNVCLSFTYVLSELSAEFPYVGRARIVTLCFRSRILPPCMDPTTPLSLHLTEPCIVCNSPRVDIRCRSHTFCGGVPWRRGSSERRRRSPRSDVQHTKVSSWRKSIRIVLRRPSSLWYNQYSPGWPIHR